MCCISATTMQRKISCLKQSKAEVAARLTLDDFPRSVRYDPLWLAEALSQVMQFEPNTRLMGPYLLKWQNWSLYLVTRLHVSGPFKGESHYMAIRKPGRRTLAPRREEETSPHRATAEKRRAFM